MGNDLTKTDGFRLLLRNASTEWDAPSLWRVFCQPGCWQQTRKMYRFLLTSALSSEGGRRSSRDSVGEPLTPVEANRTQTWGVALTLALDVALLCCFESRVENSPTVAWPCFHCGNMARTSNVGQIATKSLTTKSLPRVHFASPKIPPCVMKPHMQ